jgi:hypothetical protein
MGKYWSDKEFVAAAKASNSISEFLSRFGIPNNQGYYNKLFYKDAKRLSVDFGHFEKRYPSPTKYDLQEVLVQNSRYVCNSNLRKRLVKEGLLVNKCSECGLGDLWNEKPITLHLDHINGDNRDNRIENLRILCPNCHSQTETYCGAKKKKKRHVKHRDICTECGRAKRSGPGKLCARCCSRKRRPSYKIDWPDADSLIAEIEATSYVAVAKRLGVSDNAVRKRLNVFLVEEGKKAAHEVEQVCKSMQLTAEDWKVVVK